MKKTLALLLALAVSCSMLASCGDDSSSSSKADDSSVADSSSVADESSAEDSSVEDSSVEDSSTEDSSTEDSSEADPEPIEGPVTLTGSGEYAGDWGSPMFVDAEGNLISYVDNAIFEQYLETGCTITMDVSYYKLAGNYMAKYMLAPCNANGWEKLYAIDASYVEGVPAPEVGLTDTADENSQAKYDDGTYVCKYYFKPDGFGQMTPTADGSEWTTETISFSLSADALKFLAENCGTNDDGTTWGGLVFQSYGVLIDSLTVDAYTELPADNNMNPDPAA